MIESKVPKWIEPHVLAVSTLTFDEKEYQYLIVSSQAAKKVNGPSIFTIAKSGTLAISDTYPVEYRELGLIHELMEYRNDPVPEYGCVEALKAELLMAEARKLNMKEYIEFRLQFFSILVDYYDKKDRAPSEEPILVRLRHTREYLRHL